MGQEHSHATPVYGVHHTARGAIEGAQYALAYLHDGARFEEASEGDERVPEGVTRYYVLRNGSRHHLVLEKTSKENLYCAYLPS